MAEIDKFKKMLLQLLENDDEIKKAILKIMSGKAAASENFGNLSEVKMNNEISALKNKNQILNNRIGELTAENSELSKKYEEFTKLLDEKEKQLKPYTGVDKAYKDYCSLSEEIHFELKETVNYSNAVCFVISGCQPDRFASLWDYINHSMDSFQKEDTEILKRTFMFFFESYNEYSQKYVLLNAQVGQEFDTELHSKGSCSLSSGVISKVLLTGYMEKNTGKIIKKSVVRVEK